MFGLKHSDPFTYHQWDQYSVKHGRRQPKRRRVQKLVTANVNRVDFGFKNIGTFDSGGALTCFKNGTAAAGFTLPVYALSICHVNQTDGTGAAVAAQPFRALNITATGAFNWAVQNGQDYAGNLTTSLQYLLSNRVYPGGSTVGGMGASGYLNWSKVMFNLYGATQKAVKWRISLVRATEDEASPFFYASGTPVGPDQQQFLENMTKPWCSNPISVMDHGTLPKFKVIKTWDYDIQPTSSTESDAQPHVKTVKFFHRWGRVYRFNDTTAAGGTNQQKYADAVEISAPNKSYADTTVAVTSTRPQDKYVLFFLIQATDYGTPTVTYSNTTHASFDVSMRTSWDRLF